MPPNEIARVLTALDRIESTVDRHSTTLATLLERSTHVATREDLSTAIAVHVKEQHRPPRPINWRPLIVAGAAVLSAVAALLGAYAAN